jgi:hypothetical protein
MTNETHYGELATLDANDAHKNKNVLRKVIGIQLGDDWKIDGVRYSLRLKQDRVDGLGRKIVMYAAEDGNGCFWFSLTHKNILFLSNENHNSFEKVALRS